jgi:radical SAM protein with 4Fe4S-binding SPASM domain
MMHSPLRFIPSVFRKNDPLHLTLFVTRRCNARCPFCFYLEKDGDVSDNKEGPELSFDEIRSISGSMGNLLWLAFSGGEIYLREDLVEISRVFYENNKPSIMLYPTNGLMPELIRDRTEQILRSCPKSIITVKLSIDGIMAKHDSLRGVNGSFDRVLNTYDTLSPLLDEFRNFELGINTVFCSENQDEMDEIIEFVNGLDMIKTHTISMVRGEINDATYKEIDINKYLAAISRLEKDLRDGSAPVYSFRGARIKAAQDIIQRRLIHQTITEKRQLIPCYAGRLNLVITETGDVFACENFSENFRLGNIRDHSLDMKGLLGSERAQSVVSSIKDGCFCTHECYMMTNILFNPKMYPRLFKEAAFIR